MKLMNFLLGLCIISMTWASCCEVEDEMPPSICDAAVIIDAERFNSSSDNFVHIISATITGDCLKVKYSASGCDGLSWRVELIDSEDILESFPVQRNLRLLLDNPEFCLAVITQEMSFDISELQCCGESILLNFINSQVQVLYEF